MKPFIFGLFATLFVGCYSYHSFDESSSIPQQIHLSYGNTPLEIIVTWTTYKPTDRAFVQYSIADQNNHSLAIGETTKYIDGGKAQRVYYIHRVLLTGLQERTTYHYRCGSSNSWSGHFSFKTFTMDPEASAELLIYGDLGLDNGKSIPRIRKEVLSNKIDAILHVGDMAYDMDVNESRVGDEFMRVMQPIAAYVPYQVCVGNHEYAYNFSNYRNRFSMINMFGVDAGQLNNLFYSFYMGPALFIGFSTEIYFWDVYDDASVRTQYEWLEQTLALANKPEHRSRWPWIITFAHRPMYCSNSDVRDCYEYSATFRDGIGPEKKYGLEKLFYEFGVDIEIWAHEHSYERLYPMYDRNVYNGTNGAYNNPGAPIHIISGAAGCDEFIDPFLPKPEEWSAFRIPDYGYTRMNIYNRTHIRIQQISDNKFGKIVDEFTVVKDYHGSYYNIPNTVV